MHFALSRKKLLFLLPAVVLLLAVAVFLSCLNVSTAMDVQRLLESPKALELQGIGAGLDEMDLTVDFHPEMHRLTVSQQLRLMNRTGETLHTLVLRAYPNAFQSQDVSPIATEELFDLCYLDGFSGGSLVMTSAQVAGKAGDMQEVRYLYTDAQKTVQEWTLPKAWEPGETLIVQANYTINVPKAASRFGEQNGLWAIGNAFLFPAVWEDGAFRTDPYYAVGDPFVSDCMNVTANVFLPEGYGCVGPAPAIETAVEGGVCFTFEATAVRDVAFCMAERYHWASAMEGDTLLFAYGQSGAASQEALRYARQALHCYEERFGEYPYLSLSLVVVDFPFGGMEYPGMVMISAELWRKGGQVLEWSVAHEVAHQWWYAVVGSDQVNQAWQDEALCEYSLLQYVETYYGKSAKEDLQRSRIQTSLRVSVPHGMVPGSPLDDFATMGEYTLLVYRRGAAMLLALDTAMGGKLDDFLKAYYSKYQFLRPTRADFEALLAESTGQDYVPLMVDYLDTHILN